jgi:hypothetical protein
MGCFYRPRTLPQICPHRQPTIETPADLGSIMRLLGPKRNAAQAAGGERLLEVMLLSCSYSLCTDLQFPGSAYANRSLVACKASPAPELHSPGALHLAVGGRIRW